jgi:hypothetical protein
MRTFSTIGRRWLATLLCGAAGLGASATAQAQARAEAVFDPPSLEAGQIGAYKLVLHNTGQTQPPPLPPVPGLITAFQTRSEQVSWSFNNGSTTNDTTLTLIYAVRPTKSGSYTVPSFSFNAGGTDVAVPAATLEVTDNPVGAPATTPVPGGGGDGGNGTVALALGATVPRTEVYVGEKFPLDITLTAGADLRFQPNGGLSQNGDSFEQAKVPDQPTNSEVQQNGVDYHTFTWSTASSAFKTGNQTLSFTLPCVVVVPDRNSNPFGNDDLMARFFANTQFATGHQEQVTLQSSPLQFNVQPLPDDGKPGNFTGGIGLFSVDDISPSSTALQVGVPVTLKLTVSGQGNFDRLQPPVLDLGPLWRSYEPKQTFTPSDFTGYHGSKTFEYVLIPLSEKITDLPAPQVNFFNPDTKQYVVLPLKSIAVTVEPAPPGQAPPPLPAVNNAALTASAQPTLVGLRHDAGAWEAPSPRPLFTSGIFLAAQAAPALALATLVITRRRKLRLQNDLAYARRLRARQEARAAIGHARAAASAGKAVEFYAIAQRALQEAASASTEWKHENVAEALTWNEFDAHLAARATPAEVRDQVREIFEAGDALRFGGFIPEQAILDAAATRLEGLVDQLLRQP